MLHGCYGKMGRVMARVIGETPDTVIVCGVDRAVQSGIDTAAPGKAPGALRPADVSLPAGDYPVYASLSDVPPSLAGSVDVLIDFSHHSALDDVLAFGTEWRVPLVICTTGFSPEQKARMQAASAQTAILNSANMSLGVNLLLSLVKQAAALLSDTFDIEIVEKHHNQKVDAPSGTALMIADAINEALEGQKEYVFGRHSKTERRKKQDIGIHAVRGGAIVGEHSVIFAGQGEVVEVNHTALSRDVFAYGAVKAASFLAGRKSGLFSMKDVIESR